MFIDSVEIEISSGKGGQGAISFRREKFITKGGPDGGDGGKGGDVFFVIDRNCDTLSRFKGVHNLKAENGKPGEGRKRYGKSAQPLVIALPPGTQVIDSETNEILLDLIDSTSTQKIKFLDGGKGGLGNFHFRSSTNQRPTYAQPGLAGEKKKVRFELKLIADIGLVGFPNVGKSTLVSTLSNAHPEIANYEFTTLTPSLGVVDIDEFSSFVMADIPGIIEGASEGKGLGIEFLKHIERTKRLLIMIDISNYRDIDEQLSTLKAELTNFSEELSHRAYAIALSKSDAYDVDTLNQKVEQFIKTLGLTPQKSDEFSLNSNIYSYVGQDNISPNFIIPISSSTGLNISALKYMLYKSLLKENE